MLVLIRLLYELSCHPISFFFFFPLISMRVSVSSSSHDEENGHSFVVAPRFSEVEVNFGRAVAVCVLSW